MIYSRPPALEPTPAKVMLGQAPAKVMLGQAPAKVMLGQAPAKVTLGQAPAKVTLGQAPAKVTLGQAPANVTLGQALAFGWCLRWSVIRGRIVYTEPKSAPSAAPLKRYPSCVLLNDEVSFG